MTHRPPIFSNRSFLRFVLTRQLSWSGHRCVTPDRSILSIATKISTLTGLATISLLSWEMFLSTSTFMAVAHPHSADSTLTAHGHLAHPRTLALPEAGRATSSSQASSSDAASPWGDPYTGNGTSTDSRGSCPGVSSPLVALMPDVNSGRSLSDYPTFWFYVPYNSETIASGEFLLQDVEHNDVISPVAFTLSNTPGFVSVTLPSSAPPLKANQPYHWYFELYCQGNTVSPVYVDGWIEKTSLDQDHLDSHLPSETSTNVGSVSTSNENEMSLYSLYRDHFIWFDALDTIIQEWSEMPNQDLADELLSLLQSANVDIEEWPAHTELTPVLYE